MSLPTHQKSGSGWGERSTSGWGESATTYPSPRSETEAEEEGETAQSEVDESFTYISSGRGSSENSSGDWKTSPVEKSQVQEGRNDERSATPTRSSTLISPTTLNSNVSVDYYSVHAPQGYIPSPPTSPMVLHRAPPPAVPSSTNGTSGAAARLGTFQSRVQGLLGKAPSSTSTSSLISTSSVSLGSHASLETISTPTQRSSSISAQEEVAELQLRLSNALSTVRELEGQLKEQSEPALIAANEALKVTIKGLRGERMKVETHIQTLKNELKAKSEKLSAEQKKAMDAEIRLREIVTEVVQLEDGKQEVEVARDAALVKAQKSEQELSALATQKDELKKEVDVLHFREKEHDEKLSQLQSKLDACTSSKDSDRTSLERELNALQKTVGELLSSQAAKEKELEDLKTTRKNQAEETEKIKQEKETLEEEMKTTLSQLELELAIKKKEVDILKQSEKVAGDRSKEEISTLRDQLVAALKKVEDAEKTSVSLAEVEKKAHEQGIKLKDAQTKLEELSTKLKASEEELQKSKEEQKSVLYSQEELLTLRLKQTEFDSVLSREAKLKTDYEELKDKLSKVETERDSLLVENSTQAKERVELETLVRDLYGALEELVPK